MPGRIRPAFDRYVPTQPAHAGAGVSYRYGRGAAYAIDLLHWPGVWPSAVWADRRSVWAQAAAAVWLRALHAGVDRLRAGTIDRKPGGAAPGPGAWRLRRNGDQPLGGARPVRRA